MLKKIDDQFIISVICALLIAGMLVTKGWIVIDAENTRINEICGIILYSLSYYLTLYLSKRLQKKRIYGLRKIAWACMMLYMLLFFTRTSNIVFFNVLILFIIICFFTTMLLGMVELWKSLVEHAESILPDRVLNIEALIISAVSFIFSIIQILS